MFGNGNATDLTNSPSTIDNEAFKRVQQIARSQLQGPRSLKRTVSARLTAILSNKIHTMRLYYKISAFRKWRDLAREKHIASAVLLVQRYLKKAIVCWKVGKERKVAASKNELSKLITDSLTHALCLRQLIDNRSTLETLVASTNDKRTKRILDVLEMVERKFNDQRREAFGQVKEANLGTGIKLRKPQSKRHNKKSVLTLEEPPFIKIRRDDPDLAFEKTDWKGIPKEECIKLLPARNDKLRPKFTEAVKQSIERVSRHVRGKSKEDLMREMKLCSFALQNKNTICKFLGALRKYSVRKSLRVMHKYASKLKAAETIKTLLCSRFRFVLKCIPWCVSPKKVRMANGVKRSTTHSRNTSQPLRKDNQPSLRLATGVVNRRLRAVRAIASDQEAVKKFSAALRIQTSYKQYRFKKFIARNAHSGGDCGYANYVELDPELRPAKSKSGCFIV